jgi:hypothetical protein
MDESMNVFQFPIWTCGIDDVVCSFPWTISCFVQRKPTYVDDVVGGWFLGAGLSIITGIHSKGQLFIALA